MNRPSKWKFNKARQNWLIRNVWAPEAVSRDDLDSAFSNVLDLQLPDVYVPLVVKYLANVQGGSREVILCPITRTWLLLTLRIQKLIESCQSYLKAEEKPEPEQKDAPSSTTTETEKISTAAPLKSILKPAPGPLIAGPLIDVPSAPPAAPEGSEVPAPGTIVPTSTALSATALADIRRTRAQTLLDALNGSKETV